MNGFPLASNLMCARAGRGVSNFVKCSCSCKDRRALLDERVHRLLVIRGFVGQGLKRRRKLKNVRQTGVLRFPQQPLRQSHGPRRVHRYAFGQRARFGQDPVRTATLAYDAVALVAALVKQHPGPQRFSEQTLTASSGFAGIDGIFRFRPDGTNERGLAVMRVAPSGGQPKMGRKL